MLPSHTHAHTHTHTNINTSSFSPTLALSRLTGADEVDKLLAGLLQLGGQQLADVGQGLRGRLVVQLGELLHEADAQGAHG